MLMRDDGGFALGSCDDPAKGIYISEMVKGEKFKKVLCHELSHAAMYSYNINLTIEPRQMISMDHRRREKRSGRIREAAESNP
jgi:hypothetical protein